MLWGTFGVGAPVSAAPRGIPAPVAADGARIERVSMQTPTRALVRVYSPAMRKQIGVTVLLPRNRSRPAPTLYLLDGIDGGVYTGYTQSGWTIQTDVVKFMADKPVNVVLPIGGTASYYTDWRTSDPVLQNNKWETFLTKELPPLID
ncbi:MAG: alpha/beta hydrolase-fold protein, partial [Gordonia sp. (in: high G+C Gram-positive bacteria)]